MNTFTVCAASKEENIYAQCCLEMPNLQPFASYKTFQNIHRENNQKVVTRCRLIHMYYYDSDERKL